MRDLISIALLTLVACSGLERGAVIQTDTAREAIEVAYGPDTAGDLATRPDALADQAMDPSPDPWPDVPPDGPDASDARPDASDAADTTEALEPGPLVLRGWFGPGGLGFGGGLVLHSSLSALRQAWRMK